MIYFEDKKLAKALTKNDEKVFNHFFETYFPRLYRFTIVRLNGNKELTQDIVQETLIKALKNIKQYRGEAALFSWMCQINRNLINQYYRKNKLDNYTYRITDTPEIQEIFDNIQDTNSRNPDNIYDNDKLREVISSTLDNLPNGYGDILEWKYLDKLSVVQIAERLNTSTVAIQSKLARARETFKDVISRLIGNNSQLFETNEIKY